MLPSLPAHALVTGLELERRMVMCRYGCTGYCRLHAKPCALGEEPAPEPSLAWGVAVLALPFVLLLWAVVY